MNITKNVWLGVVLAGSVAISVSASAGGYVGGSVGVTDFDTDDDGTSFEIKGGYVINENFAIQASYIDFGEIDDNDAPVWRLKSDAIELAAIGRYAFNDQLSLIGLLGMSAWDVSVTEDGFGSLGGTDGTDLVYGVGLSFTSSESISIDLLYKGYDISIEGVDLDVSNISLGLSYTF